MKSKRKITLARQGGTTATFAVVCIACVMFFAVCCNRSLDPKIDDDELQKSSENIQEDWSNIRVNILPSDELPEWFNDLLYTWENDYVGTGFAKWTTYEVYKGVWCNSVIYILRRTLSSLSVFKENGERIPIGDYEVYYSILTDGKNWELIFQIVGGVITPSKSSWLKSKTDEAENFVYPVKPGSNEWYGLGIQERLKS